MCGIIGYTGEKNARDVILSGLFSLEYRGYDSAGMAVVSEGRTVTVKTAGKVKSLEEATGKSHISGGTGIGHTRWATHGAPTSENAHPHTSGRVTLVHNGIIENYAELRTSLEDKGYRFISETDTEVAAALIDSHLSAEGDPIKAIGKATGEMNGSFAFAIMIEGFPDVLFASRKDSPLIIGAGEGESLIASDITAILKYTRTYMILESGDIAKVTAGEVSVYDSTLRPVEREKNVSAWDTEAAEKGGYPHFMLKEINEEPMAIKNVLSGRIKDGLPDFSGDGKDIITRLAGADKIFVVACGTAMHAGLFGKYMTEKLARRPCEGELASEFRYKDPIVGKGDAVIVISQSGETADSLAALRLAKEKGAFTLGIVNVVSSSIAREADEVIYTRAGPEIAVASTKAFTVQATVMTLLAVGTALRLGRISEAEAAETTSALSLELPAAVQSLTERSDDIKEIARVISKSENAFFIGRGIDRYAAEEGSLKLKEISYIHSEAYAAGELKHGTLSLISDGVPVIASACDKALYSKTKAGLSEVKARGAVTVLVSPDDICSERDGEFVIGLPCRSEITAAISAVTTYQLLAYHTAVMRNTDVDMPKNLAKSVTVE